MDVTSFLDRFPRWSMLPLTGGIARLSIEIGRRRAAYSRAQTAQD
jgi:hypothetical protein